METDLIQNGVDLMLYGMGTVFVFLTVLVFSTSLMSYVVNTFLPEAAPAEVTSRALVNRPTQTAAAVDAKTLKIVQDAIYQHRANSK